MIFEEPNNLHDSHGALQFKVQFWTSHSGHCFNRLNSTLAWGFLKLLGPSKIMKNLCVWSWFLSKTMIFEEPNNLHDPHGALRFKVQFWTSHSGHCFDRLNSTLAWGFLKLLGLCLARRYASCAHRYALCAHRYALCAPTDLPGTSLRFVPEEC